MKTKFIALLLLVFLTSCAGGSQAPAANGASKVANNSQGSGEEKPVQPNVSIDEADKSKAEVVPIERKIIRNADLNLEAVLPEEAQQKITSIAENKGGFVIESQKSNNSSDVATRDIVTMTVRVPSTKFNESLDEIRKTSSRIIVETVSGQDVTEEFVDIEARLKTKKALESQFLEIMKQGKTVEDALKVQRELAGVRAKLSKSKAENDF